MPETWDGEHSRESLRVTLAETQQWGIWRMKWPPLVSRQPNQKTFDPKFVQPKRGIRIKMEQRLREQPTNDWSNLRLKAQREREPMTDTA